MADIPELTDAERATFAELRDELLKNGKSEQEAEIALLSAVLELRKKNKSEEQRAHKPHFERIETSNIQATKWIVKKLIEAGSLNEIFGESGTGKSFLAISLAASVATGVDFFGYKTKRPGAVLYVAGEGVGGLSRRFAAWEEFTRQSLQGAPIFRYAGGAANLLGAADELMAAIKDFVTDKPAPALAILDTWAAVLGGDDSNPSDAADGMAILYEMRAKYPDTAILIVHHSGLMEKNRARGWSGIYAGMDCVYKVTKGNDQMAFENVKNKEDMLLPPMAFKMRPVPLYRIQDEDNEIVTSVCVEQCEYVEPVDGRTKATGTKRVDEVFNVLKKMVEVQGNNGSDISELAWRKQCEHIGIQSPNFTNYRKELERENKILCAIGMVRVLVD
ncbi:hypothetical protein FACS189479_05440 [Spirochaetia bacterium]|nr:hypothetical protein FACS189479_05440 [Spirochaetia bacterium]